MRTKPPSLVLQLEGRTAGRGNKSKSQSRLCLPLSLLPFPLPLFLFLHLQLSPNPLVPLPPPPREPNKKATCHPGLLSPSRVLRASLTSSQPGASSSPPVPPRSPRQTNLQLQGRCSTISSKAGSSSSQLLCPPTAWVPPSSPCPPLCHHPPKERSLKHQGLPKSPLSSQPMRCLVPMKTKLRLSGLKLPALA